MKAIHINALEYNMIRSKGRGFIRIYGEGFIPGESIRLDVWSIYSDSPAGLSLDIEVINIKQVSPMVNDVYELEICVKA